MPFKSQSQRKYMFATDPKMAEKFAKDTPKGTELPDKIKARTTALMNKAKAGK